jgi:hypothetical protein
MRLGFVSSAICHSRAVVWIGIYSIFHTLGLITFVLLGFVWMWGSEKVKSSRFTRAVWPIENEIYHVGTSGHAKEVVLTTVWLSIWTISNGCDGGDGE